MRRFAMPCTRFLASSLVIMAMAGCISTALHHSTTSYYAEGPEQALRALDHAPIRQQDRILAGMERAVALQELGRYRDSNAELFECQRLLEASRPDATGLLINDEVALYRGESFEQIYLHTLAISNSLALQDVFAAADQAQHALGAIQTVGCRSCRFPFTRPPAPPERCCILHTTHDGPGLFHVACKENVFSAGKLNVFTAG